MKKICKRCGLEKEINEFRLMRGDKKDYYLGICKKCESERQKEYFKDETKREKHLEYAKRYREKHKEELKKKNHEYNMVHREERARKDTKAFLKFKIPVDWDLYMRETGCLEPDHDVKRKIIKELMEDYDIMFAIDDRINNCKVYQECGIIPLHVIVNDPRFPV